ncbi:transposase [Maribacter zhoushanensis]|uniref:transposase n=1 Tax=Maribacter zhoushanensis TaxID=3030012 RepID=UPI003B83652E
MLVTNIYRDKGITTATFYSWKRKYGNMDVQQLKKLKSVQEENRSSIQYRSFYERLIG